MTYPDGRESPGPSKGAAAQVNKATPGCVIPLSTPALSIYRSNSKNALLSFRQRLSEKGKAPKLILGALMRRPLQVICDVLKHDHPFNPFLT